MQEDLWSEGPVYTVNDAGVMCLAGHDIRDLMAMYGSPLVVLLEEMIRQNCRRYRKQIEIYPRSRVYYASKAFLTVGFCRLMDQEGMGLDVASAGELDTALAADFPAERILMHGNAKTEEDLRLALEVGVGRIVVDNLDEIERLEALAGEVGKTAVIMIRVTPGIKPSTHHYVQTGQIDSKFGFNLQGGAALEAIQKIQKARNLRLIGLHCHIGSQIFDLQPFTVAVRAMMEFYRHVKVDRRMPLDELNLGGGLGIRYLPDDQPPAVIEHLRNIRTMVLEIAGEMGIEAPLLCDEPGRSIIGRAGVTLYTVQSRKRIAGVRNYVSVDGGMTDNPRFALYEAKHQVLVADRMKEEPSLLWSVSGRCCESGDMLQKDVFLPEIEVGDRLAMLSTGAYTYSMASNYNRVARPAVVLVSPGKVGVLAERESLADLRRLDRIPVWLQKETSRSN